MKAVDNNNYELSEKELTNMRNKAFREGEEHARPSEETIKLFKKMEDKFNELTIQIKVLTESHNNLVKLFEVMQDKLVSQEAMLFCNKQIQDVKERVDKVEERNGNLNRQIAFTIITSLVAILISFMK